MTLTMKQPVANKPHKHAALIKQWADGAVIQVRNQAFGTADVGPEWQDASKPLWDDYYEYRVKPKEYPKSGLDAMKVVELCINSNCSPVNVYQSVADAAIQYFIESGEMLKYFADPANGFVTQG